MEPKVNSVLNGVLTMIIASTTIIGCATVPPVSVYNRSYIGPKLGLNVGASKQFKLAIDVSKVITEKDMISRNNIRYVLGALVKKLRKEKLSLTKTQENKLAGKPIFSSIVLTNKPDLQSDYIGTIQVEPYGSADGSTSNASSETTWISKATANCFLVKISLINPSNPDDSYIFQSNGCPGISDPRLIASKIVTVMTDDLWLVDSARIHTLLMNGASANSWFSSFETDTEVDKILGYQ